MHTILALDTSTGVCSVALNHNGKVTENFLDVARQHTQKLLPMIDSILHDHALTLSDVDAIAFGCGPGSFTGLRICLSTVQGLAFGTNTPVIPVSTLEVLATGAVQHAGLKSGDIILTALDARMDQVYWGAFEVQDSHVISLTGEYVSNPDDIATHPAFEKINRPVTGIGEGWHYDALKNAVFQNNDQSSPIAENIIVDCQVHAADLAVIAQCRLQCGQTMSVMEADPVYLRNEIAWKKRERKRPQHPSTDA